MQAALLRRGLCCRLPEDGDNRHIQPWGSGGPHYNFTNYIRTTKSKWGDAGRVDAKA